MANGAQPFRYPDTRLIILAKAPIHGTVKTRLIPALGAARATRLYAAMLDWMTRRIVASRLCPVQLWCTPDGRHPQFQELENLGVHLHQQAAGDLGTKMLNALSSALESSGCALLIGADCPELSVDTIETAIKILLSGKQAVIGPASDGGYYLIGAKQIDAHVFTGIDWGTGDVMKQTRARLSELNWRWDELVTLSDIDRPEDLQRLTQIPQLLK